MSYRLAKMTINLLLRRDSTETVDDKTSNIGCIDRICVRKWSSSMFGFTFLIFLKFYFKAILIFYQKI